MIEIWRASLDITPARQTFLWGALSPDERAKASRYHFAADRRRYIAARGILRELLSSYVGAAPADLAFAYGPYGKPALVAAPDAPPLHFNVSHSDETALYAVTRIVPVGIDIERIRPDFEIDNIVAHFFHPAEIAALAGLPAPARNKTFFRFWTRKEAYCKALGDGFALDPRRMDASASPPSPADWFPIRWDAAPDSRFALRDLQLDDDFAAALALEGEPNAVTILNAEP